MGENTESQELREEPVMYIIRPRSRSLRRQSYFTGRGCLYHVGTIEGLRGEVTMQ